MTIRAGEQALAVPGVTFGDGASALWFYKVTCPVCQMAAPKIDVIDRAFPGLVVGVGQDPLEELSAFGAEHGTGIRTVPDVEPYEVSDAYGIEVVPTLVLVGSDGVVGDVVQSWDRVGYNRAGGWLAELAGVEPVVVSDASDGLPAFRPG